MNITCVIPEIKTLFFLLVACCCFTLCFNTICVVSKCNFINLWRIYDLNVHLWFLLNQIQCVHSEILLKIPLNLNKKKTVTCKISVLIIFKDCLALTHTKPFYWEYLFLYISNPSSASLTLIQICKRTHTLCERGNDDGLYRTHIIILLHKNNACFPQALKRLIRVFDCFMSAFLCASRASFSSSSFSI